VIYLGFDPGFSGAWGMIDHHSNFVGCGDMVNNGSYILTDEVMAEINQARNGDDMEVVIELVASMPKQGVASTFKFGMAFGATIALAERIRCPFHFVTPRIWKKALGLDSDKNRSLALGRDLWPEAPLSRQKDNGRAEALLIAEWLRLQS
jgi:Holliday junction resolvasome RuvABC endonuclease subunit